MHPKTEHRFDPRLTALVVASSNFMGALDGTIITLALPRMAHSFGIQPIALTIGITVYIVVMATMTPASAWIADRFGPRRVLVFAIAGFTVASVLCGVSRSLTAFVAARALQAGCAALMSPVGNQILYRVTPKRDFVRAVAISTTPALVAPVIGPPLGGMIITALSWPWVFFLNVPIGLVAIALTLRSIPPIEPAPPRPFDWTGFALSGAALVLLIYGLELASASGPGEAAIGLVAGGLLLGAIAIRHMRRTPHPIVSLEPLRVPTFVTASLTGGGLVRIPFRALNLILPLMMQDALRLNPFWAGLLLLGYNGGDLALKAAAGRILRRYGFRRCLVVSGTLTALASAALTSFSLSTPWIVIFIGLALAGALRSVLFTSIVAINFADVPSEELAHASILNNVSSQVLGALAVSLAGLILTGSAALHGAESGHLALFDYRIAILVMALVGLAAVPFFRRLPADAGAEVSGHAVTR